ncbi:unnamed protein product [Schistosoma turkestanicum]|nr:unnamed protein product [Schistosoma turkestanicum]
MQGENLSYVKFVPLYSLSHVYLTISILSMIIICTIIGNMFVVIAILMDRHLQRVSNYLILSLAVADLMVATLVMPISALNEVSEKWWLGIALCDIWTIMDVLCCTASILHLVVIALDRYWSITHVNYSRNQHKKPIYIMISIVWALSLLISLPTRFHTLRNVNNLSNECSINKDYTFTIFSTVGAFYLPMIFLIGIYVKIYQTARKRIRKKKKKKNKLDMLHSFSLSTTPSLNNQFPLEQLNNIREKAIDTVGNQYFKFRCQHLFEKCSIKCLNKQCCFNKPSQLSVSNEYLDMIVSSNVEKETSSPYCCSLGDTMECFNKHNIVDQQNECQNIETLNENNVNTFCCCCGCCCLNGDFVQCSNECCSIIEKSIRNKEFNEMCYPSEQISNQMSIPKCRFCCTTTMTTEIHDEYTPNYSASTLNKDTTCSSTNDYERSIFNSNLLHLNDNENEFESSIQQQLLKSVITTETKMADKEYCITSPVLLLTDFEELTIDWNDDLKYPKDYFVDLSVDSIKSSTETDCSHHENSVDLTNSYRQGIVVYPKSVKLSLSSESLISSTHSSVITYEQSLYQINSPFCYDFHHDEFTIIDKPIDGRNSIDEIKRNINFTLNHISDQNMKFCLNRDKETNHTPVMEKIDLMHINKLTIDSLNTLNMKETPTLVNNNTPNETNDNLCHSIKIKSNQSKSITINNRMMHEMELNRERLECNRENKVMRTLSIITGCFILCWLPFFLQALIVPFCPTQCNTHRLVGSFFLWLGYLNSLLNPILYTVFAPDFRNAFRKIIYGKFNIFKI